MRCKLGRRDQGFEEIACDRLDREVRKLPANPCRAFGQRLFGYVNRNVQRYGGKAFEKDARLDRRPRAEFYESGARFEMRAEIGRDLGQKRSLRARKIIFGQLADLLVEPRTLG